MDYALEVVTSSLQTRSDDLPDAFRLHPNYPNPFNSTTTFYVDVAEKRRVILDIYDLLGRRISRVHDSVLDAGSYEFKWNPADLASGVYFVRMVSGPFTRVRKCMIIR